MAAIAISCGLVVLFGFGSIAQAQVQKSGKVTLKAIDHIILVVQRFPEKSFISGGSTSGVYVSEPGGGFGHGMAYQCSGGEEVSDLPKGVFPMRFWGCIARDKEGDAIFTITKCSMSSSTDWCGGNIVGGTGKYAGITGTTRMQWPADTNFRRRCVAAPKDEDCKAYYASGMKVPVGVTYEIEGEEMEINEWEWKIP